MVKDRVPRETRKAKGHYVNSADHWFMQLISSAGISDDACHIVRRVERFIVNTRAQSLLFFQRYSLHIFIIYACVSFVSV